MCICTMHIEVHTVHVSFQDEPAQPPWNVTWVPVTPDPPPEKGAVLHGLPSSSITSLWFIAVHFFERMGGIWLCPIAMHSVCNGDCFRKCRVMWYSLTMCKSQSKVHEFVRPLYMFVSQLHIWVCGRAWRGSSGRISGRQGVGTDQWLHQRSYSRRRSWSECGVDSLKFLLWGLNLVRFEKNVSEHNTVNQHRSLVFLLFNNLVHHLYHQHRTEIIIVFWVYIIIT